MLVTRKDDQPVSPELDKAVNAQIIYWSDDRLCHWFFDFQFNGQWISSCFINNELTQCVIDVF
jgi:hypothetical protein